MIQDWKASNFSLSPLCCFVLQVFLNRAEIETTQRCINHLSKFQPKQNKNRTRQNRSFSCNMLHRFQPEIRNQKSTTKKHLRNQRWKFSLSDFVPFRVLPFGIRTLPKSTGRAADQFLEVKDHTITGQKASNKSTNKKKAEAWGEWPQKIEVNCSWLGKMKLQIAVDSSGHRKRSMDFAIVFQLSCSNTQK